MMQGAISWFSLILVLFNFWSFGMSIIFRFSAINWIFSALDLILSFIMLLVFICGFH